VHGFFSLHYTCSSLLRPERLYGGRSAFIPMDIHDKAAGDRTSVVRPVCGQTLYSLSYPSSKERTPTARGVHKRPPIQILSFVDRLVDISFHIPRFTAELEYSSGAHQRLHRCVVALLYLLLISNGSEPGRSVSIVSGYVLDDEAVEVRSSAEAKGFLSRPAPGPT
jgi:hypothetical protein